MPLIGQPVLGELNLALGLCLPSLRDGLLQNRVIIEALKYRYHRGKRNNLHLWREAKGNEVDLLIENGPDVLPVEIKAGAAIADDDFKGLRAFTGRLPVPPPVSALAYGGNERPSGSEATVWRWADVPELGGVRVGLRAARKTATDDLFGQGTIQEQLKNLVRRSAMAKRIAPDVANRNMRCNTAGAYAPYRWAKLLAGPPNSSV